MNSEIITVIEYALESALEYVIDLTSEMFIPLGYDIGKGA